MVARKRRQVQVYTVFLDDFIITVAYPDRERRERGTACRTPRFGSNGHRTVSLELSLMGDTRMGFSFLGGSILFCEVASHGSPTSSFYTFTLRRYIQSWRIRSLLMSLVISYTIQQPIAEDGGNTNGHVHRHKYRVSLRNS